MEDWKRRYQALLDVSESISLHKDIATLLADLTGSLRPLIAFDYLVLTLSDPVTGVLRVHTLATRGERRHSDALPVAYAPEETPSGTVMETQQMLLLDDIEHERRWPGLMNKLRSYGVKVACYFPLTTAHRKLGTIAFGVFEHIRYSADELEFMEQVARQVALAVDNALYVDQARSYEEQLTRDRDRLHLLLEINNRLTSTLNRDELFGEISRLLREVVPNEYLSVALPDHAAGVMRLEALDFPGARLRHEKVAVPLDKSPSYHAIREGKTLCFAHEDLSRTGSDFVRELLAHGLRWICCVPLRVRGRILGTVNLGRTVDEPLTAEQIDVLEQVSAQCAIALENAIAYREIEELKDRLARENVYLGEEIQTEYNFEEMIGDSPVFRRVLEQVQTVAPTDATVLIQGETGTGKELIARAIHNHSRRRSRTMVRLNCAAVPAGLLESELFGHEKGAFTGAISQRIGRFELAHQGTLFLDEIGDIPLELQPKLLRALQEHEIERLGSSRTIRVDVRLIAATNRDLAGMVAAHEFRSDLYYRLNVFPISIPALRERASDIPMLVRYFVQRFSRKMGKRIETIPHKVMESLTRYSWPGNVRELENLMERAVILTNGPVLHVPSSELRRNTLEQETSQVLTMEEAERRHIIRVLQEANWVLGGPAGAAVRLGMKRTTLQSRMKKLGIERRSSSGPAGEAPATRVPR
jgi:formate hydrogenlyase transcriptional activator